MLQRAVQILKRHKDIEFDKDLDSKPASIIITTLAARAYENESDPYNALSNIVEKMPLLVETRTDGYWVENPVDKKENFADRWKGHPEKSDAFFEWAKKAESDFAEAIDRRGIHEVAKCLKPVLGEETVAKAIEQIGNLALKERKDGRLMMAEGTGTLGVAGKIAVKDHTFYGS